MIDPTKITNFNRTEAELQEFLLFCIVVAGKNSHVQAKKLDLFVTRIVKEKGHQNPFDNILARFSYNLENDIYQRLTAVAMGQYERITHAFIEVSKTFRHRSLSTVTVAELESIKGIGSKTARFFVMHSRPNQRVATLDTHILKWLKSQGYNVPKATPSKKKYLEIEQIYLNICDSMGKTPAELDLEIWKQNAVKH
jgi:thermostable 8-oxoguanine DNA glycosylase